MKVLLDSYDKVMQNPAGGVQMRIDALENELRKHCEVKRFDKWNDIISEYDVLHIFRAGVDRYDLIKYAKSIGVKVVISPIVPDNFNNKKVLLNRVISCLPLYTGYKFLKEEFLMADALLPQNSVEANNIVKYYGSKRKKIEIMPNGCSLIFDESKDVSFLKKYNIKDNYVLCVGRIDRNKNQLSLIKALKDTDIKLVLIGGPDQSDIEYYERCKLEAGDNVLFAGWISHNDPLMISAYKNAKVVTMSSYKEIFGNSYIEGGCAGAVLAVTETLPTVSDYNLEKYTYCYDPKNVEDIKRILVRAYNENKNENEKQYFNDIFSWDAIAKKHLDIYKKIMSEAMHD